MLRRTRDINAWCDLNMHLDDVGLMCEDRRHHAKHLLFRKTSACLDHGHKGLPMSLLGLTLVKNVLK